MRRGNCWLYAVPRWLKNPRGTYLVVRLSKHGFWPHVLFAPSIEDLEVEEFRPWKPQRGIIGFFHAIFFKGYVRKGTGEER